jgi:hypothetical protein
MGGGAAMPKGLAKAGGAVLVAQSVGSSPPAPPSWREAK